MQTTVTFRRMKATDGLKDHANEKMQRLTKYVSDPVESHVVLSMERYLHKAEINMSTHGMLVRGQETSSDMYNSIDRAVEKIENQLRKYHSKLIKHKPREGVRQKIKFKEFEAAASYGEGNNETPANIIEMQDFEARPMMLDEAVMQMDLLNDDILVFLNPTTSKINVLYRKKGDKYGLIETHSN